jgi:inhibitor of KinA sporulation pathway (predicted exonuclease)
MYYLVIYSVISDVITIWDSFDAATGEGRGHKSNRKIEEIIFEFENLFGTQFNQKYLDTFSAFVRTKDFSELTKIIYPYNPITI